MYIYIYYHENIYHIYTYICIYNTYDVYDMYIACIALMIKNKKYIYIDLLL